MFFINNPLLFLGLLLLASFMFLLGRQIIREIHYNRLLKSKKISLRSMEPQTNGKQRLLAMSGMLLAPMLVIGLFLGARFIENDDFVNDQFIQLNSEYDIFKLQEDFEKNYVSTYRSFGFGAMEEDAMDGPEVDSVEDAGDEGSDDFSGTNNQVQGVDEIDNVVTDGQFLYTIQGNNVYITLAYTTSETYNALDHYKTIEYTDEFYPTGLYIDGDHLVVVGQVYNLESPLIVDGEEWYGYYYQQSYGVEVKVYDAEADFAFDTSYIFSGSMIGTRKIDDQLIIITSSYLPYAEDTSFDGYLPRYYVDNQETIASYEDIRYVEGSNPNVFLTFYSVNLSNSMIDQNVLLGDSAFNLYVSNNNIYLVGSVYMFSVLADVVNLEEPVRETKTAIIKLSINEDNLAFAHLAHIKGFTLNQFSMDEYDGYLRITTTTSRWSFGGSNINNRLYILDQELKVVSLLENLGKPGETIQSTRFMGDYAYLVTFEQTDPFYVINVSDPDNPFVEGELEIPGFSAYLQAYGENFMLGIGFGDSNGGTQGVKISLYDITDKENPDVFDEVIYDYSNLGFAYTSATYNHKDLLLSYSKGFIALPFTTYNYSNEDGRYYNSGIMVFHIDENNGLSFGGYIQHEVNADEEVYVFKSKFIDQYIYTVSNQYIKVSTIDDPLTILNTTSLVGN